MDTRRFARAGLLWVFGIATTVSLISLWGRAVAADTDLLGSAAAEASRARLVADRVEDWLIASLGDGPGVEDVVVTAVSRPEVEEAIGELVAEAVVAASLPDGERVVDVSAHLRPVAPVIAGVADQQGIPLSTAEVEAGIAGIRPIVVDAGGDRPVVGPSSAATRAFFLATAAGLIVMLVSGAGAWWLAEDRAAMLRSLLQRVALSALSFAVMTRLGAWVLDPGGGRSPARTALAELVGAKAWVPLLVAGVGIALALLVGRRQLLRPVAASPSPPEPATPPPGRRR